MKRKNQYLIVAIIILALGTIGYWNFIRPSMVRSKCISRVRAEVKKPGEQSSGFLNNIYRVCLAEHGMKPEDLISK